MKTEEWYEFINEAIENSLKETIEIQLDPKFDPFETADNKAFLLASFFEVLRYYSTPDKYKQYVNSLNAARQAYHANS